MKSQLKLLAILAILFPITSFASEKGTVTRLESPYYTFPRSGDKHLDLSSDWKLVSLDDPVNDISELKDKECFNVQVPSSVHLAYYRAGKLPAPYAYRNSERYTFLEQKVHYYIKTFDTPKMKEGDFAMLSFEGVDYTSKVWVNGTLTGIHEGMFGGPSVRIDKLLNHNGENTIVVEVCSANYGIPNLDPYDTKRFIHSWFFSKRGDGVCPFFHHGMWNGARLDILSNYHLERPFMTTKSIKDGIAEIGFSTEIFCGKTSKDYSIHPWEFVTMIARDKVLVTDDVKVVVRFSRDGHTAYEKQFSPKVVEGRCWMEESFEIHNPKLWYPNQMGDQDLYKVSVLLYVNDTPTDEIEFDYGIRTIDHVPSAGIRMGDKWNDWQFVINGEKIFVKGVNWMPLDALSDLSRDNYEWAIKAAKDMGVQMFRIWGTGYLETDTFYDLCNKYGIMVWQDFPFANCNSTQDWPQDIWEAQVCQNIFRLRNQPSLAVWCGGNEFNAYSYENSHAVGILERSLHDFDPSRVFFRSTPDGGSAHIYIDFDPNSYKSFPLLPYIAESGIHCMSSARNNRAIIDNKELNQLGDISEKSFPESHPDFVHHFAEYNPNRVPRMMSRASHIDDMSNPVYEDMVEATQIGAGEFYQVMSEGVQSNYPVTVGLMPWVYKRPWPVVAAIELMDAFGQPTAPYYFLKRTYEKTHVMVDLTKMLYAPGDEIQLKTNVINSVGCEGFDGTLSVTIFNDDFKEIFNSTKEVKVEKGTSVTKTCLGNFKIPDDYHKKYFFIIAKLNDLSGAEISRSVYWPRTIPEMENQEYHSKYIQEKPIWPTMTEGPWLKPTVAAHKTIIKIISQEVEADGGIKLKIANKGKYMSPITIIDTDKGIFYASDNYFCLEPGETKEIVVSIRDNASSIKVSSWNSEPQLVRLP